MRAFQSKRYARFWCGLAGIGILLHISQYRDGGVLELADQKTVRWRDAVSESFRTITPKTQASTFNLSSSAPVEYFLPSTKSTLHSPKTHIPAVIVPVLWEVDLLPENIWSIDVPVKKIILVVNHLNLPAEYEVEHAALRKMQLVIVHLRNQIPDAFLDVIQLEENLGFARSMNLGMRKVRNWAPWWLCVNVDINYPPGALLSVLPMIWDDHRNGTLLYMLGHGFSAIILTKTLLARVGMFDEHIWPAYVEDCDLMLRVRMLVGDANSNHHEGGESGKYLYLNPNPPFHHIGGQGSSSNSGYGFAARVHRAHTNNIAYYLQKWGITAFHWEKGAGIHPHGCGAPMDNQYSRPFNLSYDNWEASQFVVEHDKKQKEIFGS